MQRPEAKNPPKRPSISAETGNLKMGVKNPRRNGLFAIDVESAVLEDWMVETIWTKLAAPHAGIEPSLRKSSQERNFLLQRPGGEMGSFASIAGTETALTSQFGRHAFENAALLRVSHTLYKQSVGGGDDLDQTGCPPRRDRTKSPKVESGTEFSAAENRKAAPSQYGRAWQAWPQPHQCLGLCLRKFPAGQPTGGSGLASDGQADGAGCRCDPGCDAAWRSCA